MPASDPAAPARDAAPVVIRLDGVGKRFGEVVAVADAHLAVRRGEFFSLLGPSGCGKTTLLRLIAGFEEATSGRILLEGVDVARVPPHRRNVNTVFQQYALFPHLTVAGNVAFGPRMRGLDAAETRARVAAMLAVVRLEGLGARSPAELSGGQKQRVALARALVNEPSALLLDEPLAALDLKLRQAMQLELKRIQREVGVTFVFVTHDQEEALTMSDRIAVMRGGRIAQVGSPQEIYDAPASAFVAGFIGQANLLPARVESARGGLAVARLANRHPTAAVSAAELRLAPGDAALVMIRPERVRLSPEKPASADTAFPVTVVESSFRGPVLRHVVRDAHGLELVAHAGVDEGPARPAPGDVAWVSWPAGAARLLPPDDA